VVLGISTSLIGGHHMYWRLASRRDPVTLLAPKPSFDGTKLITFLERGGQNCAKKVAEIHMIIKSSGKIYSGGRKQ
jgi:hypothetical protein